MTGLRLVAAVVALVSAAPAFAAKKPLGAGERIDLARAGVADLMRLPQIGRKKAEAIVAYRSRTPLRRVDDLLSVKGISGRWLERQRPHLTVGGTASPAPGAGGKAAPPRGK